MDIHPKCAGANCASCTLAPQPFVPSTGPEQADIVFVSEAPGSWEVHAQQHIVGQAGQVLTEVMQHVGIDRSSCFMTSAVLCRPREAQKPSGPEMQACHDRLIQEIKTRKPKVVVLLGNTAVSAVMGIANPKVTALRSRILWHKGLEAHVMATYHPAALLHAPSNFQDFVNDLYKVKSVHRVLQPGEDLTPKDVQVTVANNFHTAARALEFLSKQTKLTSDIETSGFLFYGSMAEEVQGRGKDKQFVKVFREADDVLSIAFSWCADKAVVFTEDVLSHPGIIHGLKGLYARKDIKFIWHNGKFDTKFLRARLGLPARVDADTMLKHYVTDERRGTHDLKDLGAMFCDAPDWEAEIKKYLPNKKTSYRAIPKPILYKYAGFDTAYTWRLDEVLDKVLVDEDAWAMSHGYTRGPSWAYHNLLVPAARAFTDIELSGIGVDVELNAKLEKDLRAEDIQLRTNLLELSKPLVANAIAKLQQMKANPGSLKFQGVTVEELDKRINALEGINKGAFNPRSPLQVQVVLYDCLNMPKPTRGKNKGKRSTDKKWLDFLKKNHPHPFIEVLLNHRKTSKLLSTYVEGIAARAHIYKDANGSERWIYHPDYRLHGTITGRLAEPVIVLIPRKAGGVKKMFTATQPGWVIVQADYSQAELRMGAVFSGDEFLRNIYFNDQDLHDIMSVELYGPNFTSEERVRTKGVNFGIPYGRENYSLAMEYNMTPKEAQGLIDKWFDAAKGMKQWIDEQHQKAKNCIPAVTPLGRIRRFGLITDLNWADVKKQAVNFPLQSVASDMTLLSLLTLHNDSEFSKLCRIMHFVHDSIVVQCPVENVHAVVAMMKKVMETVPGEYLGTDVPFKADFELGPNWGTLTKYKAWCEDNKLDMDKVREIETVDISDEPVFIVEEDDYEISA